MYRNLRSQVILTIVAVGMLGNLASAETPSGSTLRALALPWHEAELRTEAAQTIAKVLVREGETVRVGQLLLEFDRRVSRQRCDVTVAAQAGAKANWQQAKLELQLSEYRHQQLRAAFEAGASTRGELHEAVVRRDQARAAVTAAEQAVVEAAAQTQLAEVEDQQRLLKAPFDGVIMRVNAEVGEVSDTSQPLMVLADLSSLRVEWPMPVSQTKQLTLGSSWQLSANVPVSGPLKATLVAVEPRINPVTQTMRVVFQVANPNRWPAGFSVTEVMSTDGDE